MAPEGWEIEDTDPATLLRERLGEGPLLGAVVSVESDDDNWGVLQPQSNCPEPLRANSIC